MGLSRDGSSFGAPDRLYSIENVIGTAFKDELTSSSINNTLHGGAGDDTLYGGQGVDTYIYHVGDGDDVIHDDWREGFSLQWGAGITDSHLSHQVVDQFYGSV